LLYIATVAIAPPCNIYVLTTDVVDSWSLLLFERAGSFAYFGDGYVINQPFVLFTFNYCVQSHVDFRVGVSSSSYVIAVGYLFVVIFKAINYFVALCFRLLVHCKYQFVCTFSYSIASRIGDSQLHMYLGD